MIQKFPPIILASQSPRRKQILEMANIPFSILVSNSDENYPKDLKAEYVPIHISDGKATAIVQNNILEKDTLVIAADTVVIVDDIILGKPKDRSEAFQFLTMLSGKMHQVITGVTLLQNEKKHHFSAVTNVYFNELTEDAIGFYLDNYQPYDKAGAYAIQEWIGLIGIEKIEGDYYNVMGLPANRLLHELQKFLSE